MGFAHTWWSGKGEGNPIEEEGEYPVKEMKSQGSEGSQKPNSRMFQEVVHHFKCCFELSKIRTERRPLDLAI